MLVVRWLCGYQKGDLPSCDVDKERREVGVSFLSQSRTGVIPAEVTYIIRTYLYLLVEDVIGHTPELLTTVSRAVRVNCYIVTSSNSSVSNKKREQRSPPPHPPIPSHFPICFPLTLPLANLPLLQEGKLGRYRDRIHEIATKELAATPPSAGLLEKGL